MAFKDLLVQIDPAGPCSARLDLAARLARDHEAHLAGLYVVPRFEIPGYARIQLPPDAWAVHERGLREALEKAEADFTAHMKAVGISAEWRGGEGDPVELTALHARYADLAVVGQADPDEPAAAPYARVAEEVALTAGRPVLVIPYAGTFPTVGSCVMVAWNASREATRAVNDALPFLRRAKRVTVLAVNPRGSADGHGDVPGADMSLHLARHGVPAEASSIEATDIEVGDLLLSRAADIGADLIVMGAYGRSRMRELILGGVTRHLLGHLTVPVLMSH